MKFTFTNTFPFDSINFPFRSLGDAYRAKEAPITMQIKLGYL